VVWSGRAARLRLCWPPLIFVMDKVTSLSVRAEACCVESAAKLCLVTGMSVQASKLIDSVSELTLGTISAMSSLLEWSAHLSLVSPRFDLRLRSVGFDTVSSLQGYAWWLW